MFICPTLNLIKWNWRKSYKKLNTKLLVSTYLCLSNNFCKPFNTFWMGCSCSHFVLLPLQLLLQSGKLFG